MEERGNLILLSVEEYRRLVEDRAVYLNDYMNFKEENERLGRQVNDLAVMLNQTLSLLLKGALEDGGSDD